MDPIASFGGNAHISGTEDKHVSTKSKEYSMSAKGEYILTNRADKENVQPNIVGRISTKGSIISLEKKISRATKIFNEIYPSGVKGGDSLKYLRAEKWWEFHGGTKEDNKAWLKSDTHLSYPEYLLEKYGNKSQVPVDVKYFTEEEREKCRVHFEDGKFYIGNSPITGKMKFIISEDGQTFAAEVKKNKQKNAISAGEQISEREGVQVEDRVKVKEKEKSKPKKEIHHASFLAGRPIASGGVIETDTNGKLTKIEFGSGHYLTNKKDALATLKNWRERGVVLAGLECSEDFRVGHQELASIVTHYDKMEVDAAKYYSENGNVLPDKLEFKLSADEKLGAEKEEIEINITPRTTPDGKKGYILYIPNLVEGSRVNKHMTLVHEFLASKGFKKYPEPTV